MILTSALPMLLSTPAAVLATLLVVVFAFEAVSLLRAARRRFAPKAAASVRVKLAAGCEADFEDLETPSSPHAAKSSNNPPKVKLLPLPESEGMHSAHKLALSMVPMARISSAEQRLETAIEAAMNVFKGSTGTRRRKSGPGPHAPMVRPLDVIRRLRSKDDSAPRPTYGCATIEGTKVTLIDAEDMNNTSSAIAASAGPLVMPSRADDLQTKSLIGDARKVSRRCAECTRPLGSECEAGVFVCSRCSAAQEAQSQQTAELPVADAATAVSSVSNSPYDTWDTVKSRRRRKSEKASTKGKSKSKSPRAGPQRRGGRRSRRKSSKSASVRSN